MKEPTAVTANQLRQEFEGLKTLDSQGVPTILLSKPLRDHSILHLDDDSNSHKIGLMTQYIPNSVSLQAKNANGSQISAHQVNLIEQILIGKEVKTSEARGTQVK